jgi:hypothetical protein
MKQPAQGCHWFGGGRVGSLIAAIISDKNPIYVDKVRPDFRKILEIHKIFQIDNPSSSNLYLIALPATHLRRCGGFVTSVQVFDLTHVYDAAIPAQSRAT